MKQIILAGLLLSMNQVLAQSAATVLFTQKKVSVNRNGNEHDLIRGAVLDPGDEIRTADDSAVHIQYSNGTLVNIGANSDYKILAYSPQQSEIQIKAQLSNGSIEIENPGKIKETLKTPIISLAILGTHINVDVISSKMTYVRVLDGLVLARNEFLRPGESVRVTSDQIVSTPFPKEGIISSPSNTPGKIDTTTNTNGTSIEPASSSTLGAQAVNTVTTNQGTGTSTSSATQAIQNAPALANISLSCNF